MTLKYIAYLILIILLLSVNIGFFSYFKIYGTTVNLLLILTVLTALQRDFKGCMFVAAVSGIFLDCYTGIFFGSFTFAFIILSFLLRVIAERTAMQDLNWKYVLIALTASLLFVDLFLWQYNVVMSKAALAHFTVDWRLARRHFIPELMYNALLLYPVYLVLNAAEIALLEYERRSKFK